MYKPGAAYAKQFSTSNPTTGVAQNADSLPVATADHIGGGTGAFVLTVTLVSTGLYRITGTVPGTYAIGDVVNVSVAATVATVAGVAVVDTFQVDSKRIGDLNDSAYAGGDTSGTTTLLTRVTGAVALASQIPSGFTSALFASAGVFSTGALANAPTGGSAPSAAAIATAVWQDTTSGDFTVSGSPGKTLLNGVPLNLAQTGLTPRALDVVSDAALTLGDALVCAITGAAGQQVVTGTSYALSTPHTATPVRTFLLNSSTAPTSRL